MALPLLLYDVLYLALAFTSYGVAGSVALRCYRFCERFLPGPPALAISVLAGLLTLIAVVGALSALCPRLVPGRYPLGRGRVFVGWVLRSILRRVLLVPGLKWVLYSSNVLRFLTLRALGAKVAFTASISTDVEILDPQLFEAGANCIVGARCFISGHFVKDGELFLRKVSVGEGALLALQSILAPGAVVGPRAVLKPGANLAVGAQVGEAAEIGLGALVDSFARIGPRAVVATMANVPPRTKVAEGARFGGVHGEAGPDPEVEEAP